MLLDEPLVNLDYKLREELREELGALFASGEATVVYATTEPGEALLLGGWTAVLDAGELLQYGPTPEVFHAPVGARGARLQRPADEPDDGRAQPRGPAPAGRAELPVALPTRRPVP
jgi:glycerol transport system ATP-binding protein